MTYLFSNCSFGEHEEREFRSVVKFEDGDECVFLNSCRPLFSSTGLFDGVIKDCWLRANYRGGKRVDYFDKTNLDVVRANRGLFRNVYGLDLERGKDQFFVSKLEKDGTMHRSYDLELDSLFPDYPKANTPTTGFAVFWILTRLQRSAVTLVNFRNDAEPNYNLSACHDWKLEARLLSAANGVRRIDIPRQP